MPLSPRGTMVLTYPIIPSKLGHGWGWGVFVFDDDEGTDGGGGCLIPLGGQRGEDV